MDKKKVFRDAVKKSRGKGGGPKKAGESLSAFSSPVLVLLSATTLFVFISFSHNLPPLAYVLSSFILLCCSFLFLFRSMQFSKVLSEELYSRKTSFLHTTLKKYPFPTFYDVPMTFQNRIYAIDAICYLPQMILFIQHFPETTRFDAIKNYTHLKDEELKVAVLKQDPLYLTNPDKFLNTLIDSFPVRLPIAFIQPSLVFRKASLFRWDGFNPEKSSLAIPFFTEEKFSEFLKEQALKKKFRQLWRSRRGLIFYMFFSKRRILRKQNLLLKSLYHFIYKKIGISIYFGLLAFLEIFFLLKQGNIL